MSKIICITNSQLCKNDDFLHRIHKIVEAKPDFIILREKHLTEEQYNLLAQKVLNICEDKVKCILHNYVNVAFELKHNSIHLPLNVLKSLSSQQKNYFTILGASCHSLADAKEASEFNCTYVTASHIFPTKCKNNLPPKGLEFLKKICNEIQIPVYALGGINIQNAKNTIATGAKGICIMSQLMECDNPKIIIEKIREKISSFDPNTFSQT